MTAPMPPKEWLDKHTVVNNWPRERVELMIPVTQ